MSRLFINASNIHQGGGAILLLDLLYFLPQDKKCILFIDKRMQLPQNISNNFEIHRITPTLWDRFQAERKIALSSTDNDFVLCFGNLPPLFKVSGHVIVFIQNRYLVDDIEKIKKLSLKIKIRLFFERFWLKNFKNNANRYLVQTKTMQRITENFLKKNVEHFAFIPYKKLNFEKKVLQKEYDFIYVASGEYHKNHQNLLKAWILLAKEGLFPSLILTLPSQNFLELFRDNDQEDLLKKLKIKNFGVLENEKVFELYAKTTALIYPSFFESFGLPLLEAKKIRLPILASELDYVRDLLDPEETFDPYSPVSIARAVQRFLKIKRHNFCTKTSEDFLDFILEK